MALHDATMRVVLHEGEGASPVGADERHAAVRALLEGGFAVRSNRTGGVTFGTGPELVAGRWAEAVEGSGDGGERRGWPAGADGPVALVAEAEAVRARYQAPAPGAWLPWFPVIDYDRCTNCMQCLSFCLFGVYGVDGGGRIQAQQQDNCKTHCPACSRVCPEAAIMFPKYKGGPINGDAVSDADLQREKMKVDISALLGGDVYSLLRDRSERARSRFSKERDSDKALAERTKCLTKLGELVADLPPEVLSSLPSPEQIAQRAEEARRRVEEAKARAAGGGGGMTGTT
ncbi:MAG: ferredoxin family protein [Verrucomicrobiae bacterium]|nr:ferredoxin family protein [Verrucomicrobiae bacterium]